MYDDKDDKKKVVKDAAEKEATDEVKAPVSAICDNAKENAAAQIDDDSEIKPVEGFFLTSQRWH